jgi:AraC-like DNA-binding protein
MPGEVLLPSTLLRSEAAYRTFGAEAQRIGCGFWQARPGSDVRDAAFPFFALGWVLRGTAEHLTASGERTALRPGDAYLRFPGVVHSTIYGDPRYVECWLDLGGRLAGYPEAAGLVARARPVLRPGLDLSVIRRIDRALAALREAEESALSFVAAELAALVAEIARLDRRTGRDPHAALIDEACRSLEAGPEPRARLERLARRHGLSYERFRKVFAARVGCAPAAYGQRRRIDRARSLLLDGSQTVKEVAEELGYANAAAFSLRFRAHVGRAPGRFRDQSR